MGQVDNKVKNVDPKLSRFQKFRPMTVKHPLICLLLVCGYGLLTIPGVSQSTPEDAQAAAMGLHETNGRLQIPFLIHPLKLEEQNEIPIEVHGFKVRSATASWRYDRGNGTFGPTSDEEDVAVLYHADGSAYIKLIPGRLGKCLLLLNVLFDDGGIANETANSEVVYPDRKPEKFYVISAQSSDDRPHGTIRMDLSSITRLGIEPRALYKDALHPVHIPATDVKFRLISATESDPPIAIDNSTGLITARHVGDALIQTTFQDFSVLTCVDVLENVRSRGKPVVCRELVPAGMTAPLP
jgi:hypothetical protein